MASTAFNPIMDGVQEDLTNFVYKFIRSGSTSFEHFINVWKETHFCYIYCGRLLIKEVKHFTREILILAKYLIAPSKPFLERIAGVYLMYALYYTQPLQLPVRIRIEKDEFVGLHSFIESLDLTSELKPLRYCFYKLLLDSAFDYVYSDKLYTLEQIRQRELDKSVPKTKNISRKISNKEQLDHLWKDLGFCQTKWLEAESNYNQLKSSINTLGDVENFEMTEFLKPLLVIEEQSLLGHTNVKDTSSASTSGNNPRASKPKPTAKKKKCRKPRTTVQALLEEATSSSGEEPVGGIESMPHIDAGFDDEEESL